MGVLKPELCLEHVGDPRCDGESKVAGALFLKRAEVKISVVEASKEVERNR